MKLKYNEIAPLRAKLLEQQKGCCALCEQPIIDDAVLDHDHTSGIIRCVLHRGCNTLLGKIENNMARSKVDLARLSSISANLIKYIVADPGSELLHPTYKTKEERAMATKMKQAMGRGRGKGKKPPKH